MTDAATPPISTKPRFNPFSEEFRHDPYPVYRVLREVEPVHRTLGMWVLTRHADVYGVMRDKTYSAALIPQLMSRQAHRLEVGDVGRVERLGRKSLVFTDNPDHARLRGLVNRAFTAKSVAALRPRIAEIAAALTHRAWQNGGMDVIADLAAPLPVQVMCEWLGLPDGMQAEVGGWTHDIRFLLEPGLMKAEDFRNVSAVVEEFVAALEIVINARRRDPGDDLLSRLLASETASGDKLTDEELVFVCIMCFVAGNETTKSLIGNGVLAFLRHPEQETLLRSRPELAERSVDEVLRYDAPLQQTKRLATRDLEIAGQQVRAGEQVLLCMGAANRDPEAFDYPDTFDITRGVPNHLAFGHGMHGCLGGALAKLQAQVAFEALFARPERLTPQHSQLRWQNQSFIVRGLTHLPVTVSGR